MAILQQSQLSYHDNSLARNNTNNRGQIHNIKRVCHEWITGRFNITVHDLLEDAKNSLCKVSEKNVIDDLANVNSLIYASQKILRSWSENQTPLGGLISFTPTQNDFYTIKGYVNLKKVRKLVDTCVCKSFELINNDYTSTIKSEKISDLCSLLQEALDTIHPKTKK